jgi:hypothetical protein
VYQVGTRSRADSTLAPLPILKCLIHRILPYPVICHVSCIHKSQQPLTAIPTHRGNRQAGTNATRSNRGREREKRSRYFVQASAHEVVKDELGTEKLFKSMLGKVYTVRGVDKYGNVELELQRLNTVWVEPEFLKLRASARRTRKHGPKS